MKNDYLTEAQIVGTLIQVFCSSFMFISFWGLKGFGIAILLVILAIFFLRPSIIKRKIIKFSSSAKELDSLDEQGGKKILLFLLLFINAVLGPFVSAVFASIVTSSLIYCLIVGVLFYIFWQKLGPRNYCSSPVQINLAKEHNDISDKYPGGETWVDREVDDRVKDSTKLSSNSSEQEYNPDNLPLLQIAIGVVIIVLGAAAIWCLNHYSHLGLG